MNYLYKLCVVDLVMHDIKMTNISRENSELVFKLLLTGDFGVGKTRLLLRYTENRYTEFYYTPEVEFKTKLIEMDEKVVKVCMWDTAGRERFRPMTHLFYRGAHGIIIVFDLTDLDSFLNISSWLTEIDQFVHVEHEIAKLLVGNKSDLVNKRAVSQDMAVEFAKQNNMMYIETSAKTSANIEKAFMTMITEMKDKYDNGMYKKYPSANIRLEQKKSDQSGWLWPCSC